MRSSLAGARPRAVRTGAASALLALLASLVLTLCCAPPAAAHTRLESSVPAAGTTASAPVTAVTLRFTLPVSLLGDGVVIDGPDGVVTADVAAAEDGLVLVATPAAALAAGPYTVTWTAAAQDGHPLEGTFGFTVAGGAPDDAADEPSAGASTGTGHDMSGMSGSDHGTGHDMGHDPAAMGSPATDAAGIVTRLGGAAALWGGLVAAGALVFAGLVLRGRDEADVPAVLRLVRRSGVLLLGGLLVRVLANAVLVAHGDLAAAISAAAIGDSLTGTTRWDVGLQAAGAVALVLGARRTLPASWPAALGAALAGAGQVLGGHSNTVEPRWLVVTADVAHLAAAATWVGGVVTLTLLLRARRRDGRDLDAALLGARFSVVAGLSLAVVGVAGVLLAVGILDRPAQLWESTWGLFLLAKVGVVVLVAAIGTHNHLRVVPRLTARRRAVVRHAGRSRSAGDALRRSARRETALMVAVVLLTAWLVAASVQGSG
ncbi:CopD family protein [Promicromonospora sp. MEB111]|uniref:copper resistance CopC/CopD family protein n=1 Tax=Promicromonospora sp. MEB111 TaxID=3040301 RepID=UPI00255175D3|nr:CopD family protein [Promicromonospora sp. MEB111]